jgi:hypothetical protein
MQVALFRLQSLLRLATNQRSRAHAGAPAIARHHSAECLFVGLQIEVLIDSLQCGAGNEHVRLKAAPPCDSLAGACSGVVQQVRINLGSCDDSGDNCETVVNFMVTL